MNEQEMSKNPVLREYAVQNLNQDPMLPFSDISFDYVLCVVSIDYLVKPREVLQEALRVLKPGGKLVLSFSNRCFPSKVRCKPPAMCICSCHFC
jgi:ubiquinone/menaquinone biosynthesis C-methylase UbiE